VRIMKRQLYIYRFDIIGLLIMFVSIHSFMWFMHQPGMVVFSDIDFPFNSEQYLNQITGVWNHRYNTTALLNIPRLLSVLPSYIVSWFFDHDGSIFFKAFLFQNLYISAISFYVFVKRLLRIYYNPRFNMMRIIILVAGSLYYALNPWVMFRIQHIYLLVGYSLFPLVLLQFFKIFDHKFQAVVIQQYQCGLVYRKNMMDALLLALTISVSAGAIHYFFYTILLFAGLIGLLLFKYTLLYAVSDRKKLFGIYRVFVQKGLLLALFVFGFSAYWLLPYAGSILLDVAATQNNVNVLDTYTAFSRHSDILSVFLMISYWWPMVSLDFLRVSFYISGMTLLTVAFIGFAVSIKKNHIVLFLGILGVVLSVLATGVYYLAFAKWFLKFVELPVIGSVFRDPNKLAGLLALCVGIAFVFGMDVILSGLSKIKFSLLAQVTWVGLMMTVTCVYLYGMQKGYSQYFYHSVQQPVAYETVNDFLEHESNQYSIYLPIAEEMLQLSRMATPEWNKSAMQMSANTQDPKVQKSTGDTHIYNSSVDTLFHHEGNDPAVGYYLRYLHYLMDEEKTDDMSQYIHVLGSSQLVYHQEYMEQAKRQADHIENLKQQEDFTVVYENDIFTVFNTGEELNNTGNQLIYCDKGYEAFELYRFIDHYDPLVQPSVFANQELNSDDIHKLPYHQFIDFWILCIS